MSRSGLPAIARAVVRVLTPEELREEVEGDLAERLAEVAQTRGRLAARRWLLWQLAALGPWRFRSRGPGRVGSVPSPYLGGGRSGLTWDLSLGLRAVRLRPAASLLVILTIGASIGATTAVFSVVDGVLLRPLDYPDSDRLVRIWQTKESWRDSPNSQLRAFAERYPLSMPTFLDWTEADTGLEAIGAFTGRTFVLRGDAGAEVVSAQAVSSGWFDVLGVAPRIGRPFLPADDRPGATPVVVLSDRAWLDRFGGDEDAIGTTVTLDGTAYEIVGVMPRGFRPPADDPEIWTTFDEAEKNDVRDSQWLEVVGRLDPTTDIEGAAERIAAVQQGLATLYPDEQGDVRSRVVPLLDSVVGDVQSTLWFLLASVGLVLAVATLNIANVLAVLGLTRRREFAVKAALGAGAGRLVRGLFVENAVLAMLGGLLGVGVASATLPILLGLVPPTVPRQEAITASPSVLAFGIVLSLVVTVAVGILPALQAATAAPQEMMRGSARATTEGRVGGRVRSLMVSAEVALAFVLLVSAGLLGNSFRQLWSVDRGFEAEGLALMMVAPDPDEYPEREDRERFVRDLRQRLDAIPGVESSVANQVPLSGSMSSTTYRIERPGQEDEEANVVISVALENYLEVMRIPLVLGRGFAPTDDADAAPVAIVNEAMARAMWPDESPVGRRVRSSPDAPWVEVVGVAADVRHQGLDVATEPKLYVPATQSGRWTNRWVLRIRGDLEASIELARSAVATLSPGTPVRAVQILEQSIARSVAVPRFRTVFMLALSGLAAMLALIGLYGVVTFAVAQRTREIGVRMALGADEGGVVRSVVASGLRLAVAGVVAGIVIAWSMAGLLRGFLYEIEPTDAPTYLAISVAVTAVSALAAWIPARRAASVDPVTVLNSE